MNDKCGDCVFFEKNDDFPYCVTLPLYTERSPKDKACECFVDANASKGAGQFAEYVEKVRKQRRADNGN